MMRAITLLLLALSPAASFAICASGWLDTGLYCEAPYPADAYSTYLKNGDLSRCTANKWLYPPLWPEPTQGCSGCPTFWTPTYVACPSCASSRSGYRYTCTPCRLFCPAGTYLFSCCLAGRSPETKYEKSLIAGQNDFSWVSDETRCLACTPGTYQPSTTDMVAACYRESPPAWFGRTFQQTSCPQCPVGTYNTWSSASHCLACNTACPASSGQLSACQPTADRTCTPCPPGTWNNGTFLQCRACTARCPPGRFMSSQCTSAFDARCDNICPPATFNNGSFFGACPACPAGTFAPAQGSAQCTPCAPGNFSDQQGRTACRFCAVGFAATAPSASTCTACAQGFIAPRQGQSLCAACPPGAFTNFTASTACAACSPGTQAPREGMALCERCPRNTQAPNAATPLCALCSPGAYAESSNQTTCLMCPPGKFSQDILAWQPWTTVPPVRPDGISTEDEFCALCRIGTANPNSGATACPACFPGKYASMRGLPACRLCAPGFYQDDYFATYCPQCQPGTYIDFFGAVSCLSCRAGTYMPSVAATVCLPCRVSNYTSVPRQIACTRCPNNTYTLASTEGNTACLACAPGKALQWIITAFNYSIATASSALAAAVFLNLTGPSTSTTQTISVRGGCSLCHVNTVAPYAGATRCDACPPGAAWISTETPCRPCPAGSFFPVLLEQQAQEGMRGGGRCTPCPPGTHAPAPGLTACIPCRPLHRAEMDARGLSACILPPSIDLVSKGAYALPCPATTIRRSVADAGDCLF